MKSSILLSAVAALGFVTSAAAVPVVIMDATTHNGGFNINVDGDPIGRGNWTADASNPQEWIHVGPNSPFTETIGDGDPHIHGYYNNFLVNNTGETITENTVYTVSGDINATLLNTVFVTLIATENSDGTGASQVLAEASLVGTLPAPGQPGGQPDFATEPAKVTSTDVSLATTSVLNDFYLQVRVSKDLDNIGYFFVDNIVVTAVPEPASLMLIGLGAVPMLMRRKRVA